MSSPRPSEPAPAPPRASPVVWVVVGAALTLSIVIALRYTSPAAVPSAAPSATTSATTSAVAPEGSSRAEFARLYVEYLLKTYYVYERGFCRALLTEICDALVKSVLLSSASTCKKVPNDDLVLAIGRYQHQTGLPVDGKAGPETVRGILGGSFKSRRAMAEKYCPGWRPPSAAPAPSSSTAPDAHIAW